MEKRESIVFYESFYEAIASLPKEQQADCYDAIFRYGLYGEEPQPGNIGYTLWLAFRKQIDVNQKRFENSKKRKKTKEEPNSDQTVTKEEPNCDQTAPKQSPNVNVNVNDNVNVHVNENVNVQENDSANAELSIPINRDKVDYRKIVDSFNSICVSYPQVTRLSDQRKKAIKSRVKEYDEDTVIRVFQMAEDSDFLKGKNDRGWSATFDWIMKPSNFLKIYEGHYPNTRSSPKKEFKTSNPFLQMLAEEGALFDDENRDYEDFSNSQSGISAQL